MTEITVSILQALQMVALLPSVFIVCLLVVLTKDYRRIVVPVAFFITLTSGALITLAPLLFGPSDSISASMVLASSFQPACCFLLVVQFLSARVPKWPYWLVMLLPVVGGSLMVSAYMSHEAVCLDQDFCFPSDAVRKLYNVFASSTIFLMLMVYILRHNAEGGLQSALRRHKYWLVIALVFLNLMLLVNDLVFLAREITFYDNLLTAAVLRAAFIYLVITSLFRVFDQSMPFGVGRTSLAHKEREIPEELIGKIKHAMEHDQLYRELGITREALAECLGVGEQLLSRAINHHFSQNFNEFINTYRIKEARQRLVEEDTAVTVIAFEVGFNSIASFNRVFKTLTGCSPSEYRTGGDVAEEAS